MQITAGRKVTANGAAIRAARRALGLTQAELAQRACVDTATVCRWEQSRIPLDVTILRLADALGKTPDALVTDEAA